MNINYTQMTGNNFDEGEWCNFGKNNEIDKTL